jgi:hypothetical protein
VTDLLDFPLCAMPMASLFSVLPQRRALGGERVGGRDVGFSLDEEEREREQARAHEKVGERGGTINGPRMEIG